MITAVEKIQSDAFTLPGLRVEADGGRLLLLTAEETQELCQMLIAICPHQYFFPEEAS